MFNTYSHALAFFGKSRLYITELSIPCLVSYTLAMKYSHDHNVALVIFLLAAMFSTCDGLQMCKGA